MRRIGAKVFLTIAALSVSIRAIRRVGVAEREQEQAETETSITQEVAETPHSNPADEAVRVMNAAGSL